MSPRNIHQTCPDALSRRSWRTWVGSGLIAGGLNLLLFLLMPHLMDPTPARSSIETVISQVQVIRVSRPETPVKRLTPKPPPEPKPVAKPQVGPRQPAMTKLTLPFEINPRLPGGPDTLVLPDLETAPLRPFTSLRGVSEPGPGAFEPGQNVFESGELDAPVAVLARVPPIYPMNARRRNIEGWVKVLLIVNQTGQVESVEIVGAEPPEIFNESVRRSVVGWRFHPGTVKGVPVRAKVETTIRFTLE